MNQVELEKDMVDGGRAKALAHIHNNEDRGQAHNNPYAQAVYRRFVQPLADLIQTYLTEKKRGVQAGAKQLLRDFDPLVLSFITTRTLLDFMSSEDSRVTAVAGSLGRTIYGEKLLTEFEEINSELYYTLVNDFERRLTKNERHRMVVFKQQAEKNGIPLPVWSSMDVVGVGSTLLYLARDVGLLTINQLVINRKPTLVFDVSPDVKGLVGQITDFVAGGSPMALPCIEPPRDWVSPNNGGYHTEAMRRQSPCCVRGRQGVEIETDVPPNCLRALNRLQRDRWAINARILDAVDEVSQHFDVGEVLSQAEMPKPDRPEWLGEDMGKDEMTPEQLLEFSQWKAQVREWHTQIKLRGVQWGRYYEAIRVARKYRDLPVYFVYQFDYRGRMYAMTRGVSPQGSDLQKALLMAGEGAPINTTAAQFWFKLAASSRFGNDKLDLKDRIQWVDDNHALFLAIAEDAVSNRQWTEADCPFQFLAWCYEYAEWRANPGGFLTRLPLGQDGSCNGLQHFSAMLRDEAGGVATNLVASSKKQDIYGLVAIRTTELVLASEDDDQAISQRWKKHILSRSLVKRSVMTLPYGSTRFSCAEFILKEYMKTGQAPEFTKEEYNRAANWLSYKVWKAIADVVVKAPEAMEWLQNAADELVLAGAERLTWTSPSGFVVRQRYNKVEATQINTRLLGNIRIQLKVGAVGAEADKRGHRNGIAPNFVHSCDAAHMCLLINAAEDSELGHLAFIHDDYGALAPDVAKLHELIRDTFVTMYLEHNPLQEFKEQHGIQADLPAVGNLDITLVKQSQFFFCG
ncbi:RNA polymerase [Pseudomonas phage vB_PpuP-Hammaste-2]